MKVLVELILVGRLQRCRQLAGDEIGRRVKSNRSQKVLQDSGVGHETGNLGSLVFFPEKNEFLNLREQKPCPEKCDGYGRLLHLGADDYDYMER